ncbi:MAG: NAD(P)/FAD-dependent oxidoreductase [Chloroflexi bacterium]|nr:MAG: NAD(P)/FAD-dependent oxidoreductase [Chloroflexota bacterium]MBL1196948.1 NAD(P)/FAD-dependent oxidoreductase [Chloroflexota bacterium]NOH14244.1 NAD(P)/FAD-dependent oxidoreductase [Chloroflexota bacterium]
MKIAVIGAGSSGLVTLKYLLDNYPVKDIVCFEKSYSVRGCWGDQRPEFVSTTTKYTTQFSCFRKWLPDVMPEQNFEEFFRGAEFGDYLEEFAEHFKLEECIRFGVELRHLEWSGDKWELLLAKNGNEEYLEFDAVFLCTGLVNQKIPSGSTAIPIAEEPETIRDSTVVVMGGGESAVDIANHLAKPEYNNTTYLSLRSGIRVSPRYHPIRGVPSDFLRNRLLLSFSKGARNWVGERFVTFRIRFNRLLARWFTHQHKSADADEQAQALRREWDLKLKARANDGLFNVFHNKSDDFLEAVGGKRLHIIGTPVDEQGSEYYDFDRSKTLRIAPDVLVWSAGYRSNLAELSSDNIHLKDFYLGCVHASMPNLFLVGFARPIIGNIPSISEMQARFAVGVLAGKYALPKDLNKKQATAWKLLCAKYPAINTENVYPVEQYPYCDILAQKMNILPTLGKVKSLRTWLKLMLAPASTTHYIDEYFDQQAIEYQNIHTPFVIVALLAMMRLFEYPFRIIVSMRHKGR